MTKADKRKRAGVMGWPVAHSKSPALHGYWLKYYGIDGSYERVAVAPNDLKTAVADLRRSDFIGVNLTVPHKETALRLVDEISPEARRIGAVNTIFVEDAGRLWATNTDAYGFMANVKANQPNFDPAAGPAVILGAGGAARAVCAALISAGVREVRVVNRTHARGQDLAAEFGSPVSAMNFGHIAQALEGAALFVNTTMLGMTGQPPLELDLAPLPLRAVVNDIVYTPLETPLLATARARGNPVVDGLGMLLYQAQPAFEGWFGIKPAVTPELRAHVLAA